MAAVKSVALSVSFDPNVLLPLFNSCQNIHIRMCKPMERRIFQMGGACDQLQPTTRCLNIGLWTKFLDNTETMSILCATNAHNMRSRTYFAPTCVGADLCFLLCPTLFSPGSARYKTRSARTPATAAAATPTAATAAATTATTTP